MADFLVFTLYGPMAAWGDIAVGEHRVSDTVPSKSAIVGLLAAALGVRRDEQAALDALAAGYALAVRVLAPGSILKDYHTAQTATRSHLKGRPHRTRADELAIPRDKLKTILSSRTYRCDAAYVVALMTREGAPHALSSLAEALREPALPLYLGRKSCPLALPLQPVVVSADDLESAVAQVRPIPESLDRAMDWMLRKSATDAWHWEPDIPCRETPTLTRRRRDQPGNRQRWQFAEREEHVRLVGTPGEGGDNP